MQEEAKSNLCVFENFIPINGNAEFSGLKENSVDGVFMMPNKTVVYYGEIE